MESQLPPVQKLVTPKVVPLSSRTQYFKPSLSPATDSSKIHQRVDTKHKVSKFSGPYLPTFYKLGMSLTSYSTKSLFLAEY